MKSTIERITGKLDDEMFGVLLGITQKIDLPKDAFLLEQGQICRHLWFLHQGAIKAYAIINGEIHNTHFFVEECFLTNYMSILTKQPSELFFQATEDCQLSQLNYAHLENLYREHHRIEHIGRVMAETQFIAEYHRRKLLLQMDALERYEYVEEHQPEIFSRFALKDIASFLGITPVSLSRLRRYRLNKQ